MALDVILDQAGVHRSANYVHLARRHSDDFHVSVPLEALRGQGIVVYRLGPARLAAEHGGPIRLLIRDASLCHTGELDDCANIKYLSRIELSERRGRDTRPINRFGPYRLARSAVSIQRVGIMGVRTGRPKQRGNLEPVRAATPQDKTVQADPLISGTTSRRGCQGSSKPLADPSLRHSALKPPRLRRVGSALAVVGLVPEIHEALFPRDRWVPARVADDAVDVGARVGRSATTL